MVRVGIEIPKDMSVRLETARVHYTRILLLSPAACRATGSIIKLSEDSLPKGLEYGLVVKVGEAVTRCKPGDIVGFGRFASDSIHVPDPELEHVVWVCDEKDLIYTAANASLDKSE